MTVQASHVQKGFLLLPLFLSFILPFLIAGCTDRPAPPPTPTEQLEHALALRFDAERVDVHAEAGKQMRIFVIVYGTDEHIILTKRSARRADSLAHHIREHFVGERIAEITVTFTSVESSDALGTGVERSYLFGAAHSPATS